MTQEDKDLLLKDLCARLPYGVKVQCEDYLFTFDKDHMGIGLLYKDFNNNYLETPKIILSGCYYGENIKPYLFPLSSITEEQKKEAPFESSLLNAFINGYISLFKDEELTVDDIVRMLDWFNKNHLDYRGLIKKGLAIDATRLNIY